MIAIDVDGVALDLMKEFSEYITRTYNLGLNVSDITKFDITSSPGLQDLDRRLKMFYHPEGGLRHAFLGFMKDPNCYDRVKPYENAVEVINKLHENEGVTFLTAMWDQAREHFKSKMECIERYFPGIPIGTLSSSEKWKLAGTHEIIIDDKFSTCYDWVNRGAKAVIFKQQWNEVPEWSSIPVSDWESMEQTIEDLRK